MLSLTALRMAWKIGPYVLIAALAAFLLFQRVELQRDAQAIRADAATCASERQADAAKLDAAADLAVAQQRAALDAANAALAKASQAAATAGATLRAQLAAQALQPGQDGAIAPVLQAALAGLRAEHGGQQ
jgi:hypothetical protein